mgnify:FL=1
MAYKQDSSQSLTGIDILGQCIYKNTIFFYQIP